MKIAIIRIDRMGDMILTLPIIKSIKSTYSSYKIDVFASNSNAKVIKNFVHIDNIVNISKKNIEKKKYDLVLNFSPGWKSFFICLFAKSNKKANLILTSRYQKNRYSKSLIIFLSKIFFEYTLVIDRIKNFENQKPIHQTQVMFDLLNKSGLTVSTKIEIEKFLPKFKHLRAKKRICLIHLSSKWINEYYNENDFIDLVNLLNQTFNLILTTDNTTKNNFKLIFNHFKKVNNKNFNNLNEIKETTILENLNFENWVQSIYSSSLVITPECGCTHIASLCKIPSKIIYDANNKPEMIYSEYSPWKSVHEKYTFGKKNLNSKLIQSL